MDQTPPPIHPLQGGLYITIPGGSDASELFCLQPGVGARGGPYPDGERGDASALDAAAGDRNGIGRGSLGDTDSAAKRG